MSKWKGMDSEVTKSADVKLSGHGRTAVRDRLNHGSTT